MNDDQAEDVILAVQHLAIVMRDEGLDAIRVAAQAILDAAGGDAVAALVVAAAQIDPGAPTQAWWADLDGSIHGPAQRFNPVDEVVVARLIDGEDVPATKAEQDAALARMTSAGMSAAEIGRRLGRAPRSVTRRRSHLRSVAS